MTYLTSKVSCTEEEVDEGRCARGLLRTSAAFAILPEESIYSAMVKGYTKAQETTGKQITPTL